MTGLDGSCGRKWEAKYCVQMLWAQELRAGVDQSATEYFTLFQINAYSFDATSPALLPPVSVLPVHWKEWGNSSYLLESCEPSREGRLDCSELSPGMAQ